MIPQSAIDHWKTVAPWGSDLQVEQDLVISRAVTKVFSDEALRNLVAMRGGTVLNKIYFGGGSRYSEDIDLVQVKAGSAGPLYDHIRKRLDSWLGKPKTTRSDRSVKLIYRFQSEMEPVVPMRLKLEINMSEHFSLLGYEDADFKVDSPWYSGQALLKTFSLNELLATKMRALYQRKKERDLFDLWYALTFCTCKPDVIVDCYLKYMAHEHRTVRRAEFEANMQNKLADRDFQSDLSALLRPGLSFDPKTAYELVSQQLISLIPD